MKRVEPVEELFKGRHFDREVVILNVRWYISYKLSYRDLVTMMDERGLDLAHTTILRWVQYYTPEFQMRWSRNARPVGGSWRVDETYVRVKGQWTYLYRAVDKCGQIRGLLPELEARHKCRQSLSAQGHEESARTHQNHPGCYAASHRGVASLKNSLREELVRFRNRAEYLPPCRSGCVGHQRDCARLVGLVCARNENSIVVGGSRAVIIDRATVEWPAIKTLNKRLKEVYFRRICIAQRGEEMTMSLPPASWPVIPRLRLSPAGSVMLLVVALLSTTHGLY